LGYTVTDAADVEPSFGVFRKMRQALGVTAFGVNQVDLPPGADGREHDEASTRHEEVYVILSGSGTFTIDGERVELVPGRWLRVDAGATRLVSAGPEGLAMIMIGGAPGEGFTPRPGL